MPVLACMINAFCNLTQLLLLLSGSVSLSFCKGKLLACVDLLQLTLPVLFNLLSGQIRSFLPFFKLLKDSAGTIVVLLEWRIF